jgi:hypothetical protein
MLKQIKFISVLVLSPLLLTASCKPKSQLNQNNPVGQANHDQLKPLPDWLKTKPMMRGYYVGVGQARILPGSQDHVKSARQIALKDLASEIQVQVSATSILGRMENDSRLRENFMSEIRLKTDLLIEDFELFDQYEDGSRYAVLYRIDRDAYWAKKKAKKDNAIQRTWQSILDGRDAWSEGDIRNALNRYLEGLMTLEPFFDETLLFDSPTGSLDISSLLMSEISTMLTSLRLEMSPEQLVLNAGLSNNDLRVQAKVTVRGKNESRIPAVHIPIRWFTEFYTREQGSRVEPLRNVSNTTDGDGLAYGSPPSLSAAESAFISVSISPSDWVMQGVDLPSFIKNYLKTFSRSAKIGIAYKKPDINFKATELHLGKTASVPQLSAMVRQYLEQNGYRITSNPLPSDLDLTLIADTESGGSQGGIFIAYARVELNVTRRSDGKILYSGLLDRLKGADLSFESASRKCFTVNRSEIIALIDSFLRGE